MFKLLSKSNFKIKVIMFIFTIVLILCNSVVYAEEQIYTKTELEYIENHKKIYIAGNQNLEPVESYDGEKYIGILPDIFDEISNISGIEFVYINGNQNWKEYAQNNQVEIVSGIEAGMNLEQYGLKNSIELVNLPSENEEKIISIAFTEIVDDQLIEIIKKSLNQITEFEKQEIIISNATEEISNVGLFHSLISIGLVLFIISLIFFILYKKYKKEAIKAKYVDNITHMGNYQLMEKNFNNIITDNNRTSYCIVNIGIDVEHIEKLYGYAEVEKILKDVSCILSKNINKHELYARIYKESFVIMADYTSEKNIIERITLMINELKDQVSDKNKAYRLNIYAGIYVLNQTDTFLDKAVYKAMLAKNSAKEQGILVKMCTQALIMKTKKENSLENEMLTALNNDEFLTYVQPMIDIKTGKTQCLEALARWESPKIGLVKPSTFISIFENNNIIDKLDFQMYENVCKMLSKILQNNEEISTVFCNFSKKTIEKKNFFDELEKIAEKYNVPKQYIGIIIHEKMIDYNMLNLSIFIKKLKDIGFSILLDDFDSSVFSFKEIEQLHIDYVKISSKLIENLDDIKTVQIIRKIVETFHELNIEVICKDFSKTGENKKILEEVGSVIIQGSAYYPPVPIEEFTSEYMAFSNF